MFFSRLFSGGVQCEPGQVVGATLPTPRHLLSAQQQRLNACQVGEPQLTLSPRPAPSQPAAT